ncbi:coiled-coil domain-containing protein-domain-containing protein [Nemania sp. NC0429]|nr:coiled-coil domain-containing protein-domain-containing protein [Nemania sp. NC0429]
MAPLLGSPQISHPDDNHSSASPPALPSQSPDERPQPRPPRTPAHAARIRVSNRRREWLSRHPSYFRSLEHELADPVLYDTLIRRFQSYEEREKEGRAKGFGRVLEVDLLRGEARLSKLKDDTPHEANGSPRESLGGNGPELSRSRSSSQTRQPFESCSAAPAGGMNWEELEALEAHDLEKRSAPESAEEGRMRWDEFLRLRFVAGKDEDFNYRAIDEDDDYDALERREQEDAWFENEEPGWVGGSDDDDDDDNDDDNAIGLKQEGKKMNVERPLTGETGVQDF